MKNDALSDYIKQLDQLYSTGVTTEHSFRPALHRLLTVLSDCTVINEQTHIDCGAPDLTLVHEQLPIAYVETKDVNDNDLDGLKHHKEQFERYRTSLDHIVFSDYLDFHLYECGEFVDSVRIAETKGAHIVAIKENEDKFLSLMSRLYSAKPQRITSSEKLANIMAGKARLLRDVISEALEQDYKKTEGVEYAEYSDLQNYMESFRQVLVHDITPHKFADIYAQTITYGMFAARLHDNTPDSFTRQEAANLIPKTNPFLRKVFQQIAGYDLDDRIAWIVDDLVQVFGATDIQKVMAGFGKATQQTDPLMHFYEDFLTKYDPEAKKQCGVFYTPQPVVNFIVRAVDNILQEKFNLPMGLADTSKVAVEREIEQDKRGRKHSVEVPRVQVLDPATGTGTFLAETVRQIKSNMGGMMGAWPQYVNEHLIPRLYGFELMMASYTIAHLKLDMEVDVAAANRFKIYLTNSLEEHFSDSGTLFGSHLADEANAASRIKREAPIMVMLGNPPYSGISQNNGEWITKLVGDYKHEPGTKKGLKERKVWLNDDYVKFIRLGQYYVDRNKEGVLAYINNNGFLENPTFRGMRYSLLQSFDEIYILNLHGNSMKKETAPDGSKDENVFDITVGTSINIFIKTGKKKKDELAKVYYTELYGLRDAKYDYLSNNDLQSAGFKELTIVHPYYFFINKENVGKERYDQGFRIDELMPVGSMGITSARDKMVVDVNRNSLLKRIIRFADSSYTDEETRSFFFGNKKEGKYLAGDTRGWNMVEARKNIASFDHNAIVSPITYRPFDSQYIYYCKEMVDWGRESVMQHLLKPNLGFCCIRINSREGEHTYFVTDKIMDKTLLSSKDNANVFPLYIYAEEFGKETKSPNLDSKIWSKIKEVVGETTPEDIFDYIYGVLHSPSYCEKYKEFLRVEFPRIPYPESTEYFEHYKTKGHELRELHLMHNVKLDSMLATFPNGGTNIVDCNTFVPNIEDGYTGNVFINESQYFEGVPIAAWNAHIGGYQPAQKWLKDRKGRQLTFDDISHYRKIIATLLRSEEIIKSIH